VNPKLKEKFDSLMSNITSSFKNDLELSQWKLNDLLRAADIVGAKFNLAFQKYAERFKGSVIMCHIDPPTADWNDDPNQNRNIYYRELMSVL
jgi:hypothetical protein